MAFVPAQDKFRSKEPSELRSSDEKGSQRSQFEMLNDTRRTHDNMGLRSVPELNLTADPKLSQSCGYSRTGDKND